MTERSLEERVARMLDPAVWMLFDVARRDGFADSKPDEVAACLRRRRATLAIAGEIIDLVGGDIEARVNATLKDRVVPPVANEIEQLIAAEFRRKVTAAAHGGMVAQAAADIA